MLLYQHKSLEYLGEIQLMLWLGGITLAVDRLTKEISSIWVDAAK
jgi:hypothetical protein